MVCVVIVIILMYDEVFFLSLSSYFGSSTRPGPQHSGFFHRFDIFRGKG